MAFYGALRQCLHLGLTLNFRYEDHPQYNEMMERAELVQKLLHDAIMMEELDEDPEIFSDGTVYSDLDHGNNRCF